MNRRLLFAAIAGWLAIYAAVSLWRRHAPAVAACGVQIEGAFTRDGQYPGKPLGLAPAPRTWGSWSGSDTNEGTLRLGPFPAPARLRLALGGYPHHPGNDLFLEMPWLGIRLPLVAGDVGERWELKTFDIPAGWQGRLVNIVAVDHSRDIGGWLALSEPLSPEGGARIEHGFAADLAAWLVNGLLLGAGFAAAARALRGRDWLPAPWVAVAAGGAVALAGYAAFWIYLAHPVAGRVFSFIALGGALLLWAQNKSPASEAEDEWVTVAKLMLGIGLLYLALLHLFSVPRDFYDLAGNRFVAALPGDNRLPHDVAIRLYEGLSPKQLTADWLSSDRPPLQTGWQLLTWPATAALGFGATTASGTAGMWLQLLWVAGAYALLRTLGLARPRACLWTALLALSGFFLQNTVFTWPKLCSAAFASGALVLWWPRAVAQASSPASAEQAGRLRYALGALLAALAWLSHGGIAFSFLPLVPWVAWRAWRGEWRVWAVAAGAFLLLALPWIGYQKFYDPPGTRLLKWHLAGQDAIDSRGVFEAIRDRYHALTWRQIVEAKLANFKMQLEGDWSRFADFNADGAEARRSDEFSFTLRSFGWWLLGFAALGFALSRRALRVRLRAVGSWHVAFAGWTVASLVTWCLMMMSRDPAVIILGSYAPMLVLFVLLAAWLEFASPWAAALVGLVQAAAFTATWVVPNKVVRGPVDWLAATVAFVTCVALIALVRHEHTLSREKAGQPAG